MLNKLYMMTINKKINRIEIKDYKSKLERMTRIPEPERGQIWNTRRRDGGYEPNGPRDNRTGEKFIQIPKSYISFSLFTQINKT